MSVLNSQIQVDSIESYDPIGPVIVSYGASIPAGQSISGPGGMNVVGIITASQFSGDGTGLTGLSVATTGKVIAFTLIS